jgi:fructosamine-3-kinase
MSVELLTPIMQQALGDQISVNQVRGVGGGDIHQAWLADTNQGRLFVKTNHPKAEALFAAESVALQAIAATETLRCPNVISYGVTDHQAWLVMEYIEMQGQGDEFLRGQQLAQLHRHTHPQFGWGEHNFIGHTPQYNAWSNDWIDFFGQQRLKPQLELAKQNGASPGLVDLGYRLIDQLPRFFESYQPQPSLLHGDLWGGNSAFDTQSQPLIFDPASYYGDRETDLAMTELFGGFAQDFYRGYEAEWPLDEGYAQRKDLYNLYHIFNHYNLFGGYYAQQAERILRQLTD